VIRYYLDGLTSKVPASCAGRSRVQTSSWPNLIQCCKRFKTASTST